MASQDLPNNRIISSLILTFVASPIIIL